MSWSLYCANHPGAAPAERMSVAACSATDHMPREEALQILEESCPGATCDLRDGALYHWLGGDVVPGLGMWLVDQGCGNDGSQFAMLQPATR